MEIIFYSPFRAGLIVLMMRFGGGAHVMGHGRSGGTRYGQRGPEADVRWKGMATDTDPVCGMTVRIRNGKPAVHDGRVHYFCSRKHRERFEAAPDSCLTGRDDFSRNKRNSTMKIQMKSAISVFLTVLLSSTTTMATTVYIPDGSAGEVIVVDADTGAVKQRITGLEAIHGLAGSPGVKYLVAGSYSEISKTEAEAIAKPEGVSQDEHAAHHAKPAAGAMPKNAAISILTILDAQSGEAVRRIEVPGAVHHTAVSPDGRYAVATHPSADGISIIDLEQLAFKAFVATGSAPNYAVFAADGESVFVTNAGNGTISEVDVGKGFVRRNFLSGEAPEHIVISGDGARLYVADADVGKVREIATSDGSVLRSFEIGGELHGLDLSDDENTLFVSGKGDDKLASIDLRSDAMQTVSLSPAPYHLTTIDGTGKIYVSSRDEPSIWILNQTDLAVTGEIAISGEGHQMVVLP
jgi:DNA-binding beta-propeller fold protein YncE/YHS domain-containing protein